MDDILTSLKMNNLRHFTFLTCHMSYTLLGSLVYSITVCFKKWLKDGIFNLVSFGWILLYAILYLHSQNVNSYVHFPISFSCLLSFQFIICELKWQYFLNFYFAQAQCSLSSI